MRRHNNTLVAYREREQGEYAVCPGIIAYPDLHLYATRTHTHTHTAKNEATPYRASIHAQLRGVWCGHSNPN